MNDARSIFMFDLFFVPSVIMNFGRKVYVYVASLHGIRCLLDFELATVSELCLVPTPCYIFFLSC